MLVVRPHEKTYKTGFYSLYNDKMEIIGTQLLLNKELIINMENFGRDEWQFANDIALAGYKKYYNAKTLQMDCILMQSRLAEVLNCRKELTESDHAMILRYQIRCLKNMVSFSLDSSLSGEINFSNFL